MGNCGRLITHNLKVRKYVNKNGFLVKADIEKLFGPLNHFFFILVLETFNFGEDFLKWIRILLTNKKSCTINGGTSIYFKLQKEQDLENQSLLISLLLY